MSNANFLIPNNVIVASSTQPSAIKIGSGVSVATDGTISIGGTFAHDVTFNTSSTSANVPSGATMTITGSLVPSGSGVVEATQLNFNNYSTIKSDSTIVSPTTYDDTITLTSGNGITLSPNTANRQITFNNTYAVISSTAPTNTYDGLLWYNSSTQVAQFYLNGAWRQVGSGAGGNSKVVAMTNVVDLASATNTATIGISNFNGATVDTLMVYENSVYLDPTYYTCNGSGSSATIVLNSGNWNSGTELSFVVLTNTAGPTATVSGTISGTATWAGAQTFNGGITINTTPSASTDGVNKAYVDSVANGLNFKNSVRVATTGGNLAGSSYANGVLTITAMTTLDGVTLATNDRILVKDQSTATQNGIYIYTNSTTLTRSQDANASSEIGYGSAVFVEDGTTNKGSGWVSVGSGSFTLDTTAMTWTQFTGAGELTTGSGITKSGNQLSLTSGVVSATNGATKVNVDTYGRVTSAGSLASGDVTTALGFTPVKNSGDTINGSLNVTGNLWVAQNTSYGSSPSVTMPIGDSDTGINWYGDGHIGLWSNNAEIIDITSTSVTFTKTAQFNVAPNFTTNIAKINNVSTTGNFGVQTVVANASDVAVGTASSTAFSYTPSTTGNFIVYVYFRVVTAATAITITVTHNDGSGAQTHTVVNGQTESVGSYVVSPIFINAVSGTAIAVTAQAGNASQVYISGSIVGM